MLQKRSNLFISHFIFKDQTENGREYSTDTTALEIYIQDIDDRPPKFEYNEYKVYIPEEV